MQIIHYTQEPFAFEPSDIGRNKLLHDMFHLAIMIEIERLESNGGISEHHLEWAHGVADDVVLYADQLMFDNDKKKVSAAILFARFVNAMAIMAFQPGGLKFAGVRYIGGEQMTGA